VPASSIHTPI